MINCGAGVDILQLLERPTDKIFYVMDNHRPIHIANYYNETNQVCICSKINSKVTIGTYCIIMFFLNYRFVCSYSKIRLTSLPSMIFSWAIWFGLYPTKNDYKLVDVTVKTCIF